MSENTLIFYIILGFAVWVVGDDLVNSYKEIELVKAGLQQCIVRPNYDKVWMKECPKDGYTQPSSIKDEGGDIDEQL